VDSYKRPKFTKIREIYKFRRRRKFDSDDTYTLLLRNMKLPPTNMKHATSDDTFFIAVSRPFLKEHACSCRKMFRGRLRKLFRPAS
jgi:hypothetical protein